MRLAVSALVTVLSLLFVSVAGHAQVNPVYRQDPVNGNATQQQQITIPPGFGITLQSGATLACQAGATCSGGSVAVGTPFSGCVTNGGLLFNNNNVIGCSPSSVSLSGGLTMTGGALFTASGAGILGVGFGLDQALSGDIVTKAGGRIGSSPTANPAGVPDVYFTRTAAGVFATKGAGGVDATLTALTQPNADNSTNVATTAFVKNVIPSTSMPLTNSLGANVVMAASTLTDGPIVAQGGVGTWFASGTVLLGAMSQGTVVNCKLWDNATTIDSATITWPSAQTPTEWPVHLSGYLATPAGNLRISCISTTASVTMQANASTFGKDSTISAFRIQ